jgi:hypothetical protein
MHTSGSVRVAESIVVPPGLLNPREALIVTSPSIKVAVLIRGAHRDHEQLKERLARTIRGIGGTRVDFDGVDTSGNLWTVPYASVISTSATKVNSALSRAVAVPKLAFTGITTC